jgi:hypothetical protein
MTELADTLLTFQERADLPGLLIDVLTPEQLAVLADALGAVSRRAVEP